MVVEELFAVFIESAGKALGEKLADDLFNFLTKEIATKDAIKQAVAEIERYIAQVMDRLEKDLIEGHLNAAVKHMTDYYQYEECRRLETGQ
jgi:hypothetical protein